MDLQLTLDDDSIEKLAEAIAAKIGTNGNLAPAADPDDFGGTEEVKEITLTDMQDAIKEAVGQFGKDKIKALVKKVAGVDKVADIAKEKYQTVIDALKKVKK